MNIASAEVGPAAVDTGSFDAIIDVRPHALSAHGIEGSVAVHLEQLFADPEQAIPSKTSRVLIVCDIGLRSSTATERLRAMGFVNVVSLAGGIDAWRREGRPLVGEANLTEEELERYDRHLKLASIGTVGQRSLLDAHVVVVGAGGLGCPVITYLAAAGVGTITIIDDDTVEMSNLQRQPLHTMADVGGFKVDSAATSVRAANPDVRVVTRSIRLTRENARHLLTGATVVVDASDNFEARYAINDAAVQLGLPVVFASVYQMEGQVAVFDASTGPCYRCVFPSSPNHDVPLDCFTVGVLGSITGMLGSIQATETIKLIVGHGNPLTARLLIYDGLDQSFRSLPVAKNPSCPTCG